MPTDPTNGDQATAMAELTQQIAQLVSTFTAMAQSGRLPNAPTTTGSTENQKLSDTIASRIPAFVYDPEEEKTFEIWYGRYEDTITKDGASLPDDARVRLVLSKLSNKDYSHYANRLLPKVPSDFKYNDTVAKLKETFKSTSSIFRKRQDFLRTEYHGTGIEEYTGMILRRFTSSEFKKMTDDQICCMVWINGLRETEYNDMRTRALQVMEQKPNITLLELESDVKRLLDIRADSKAVTRATTTTPEVNAVHNNKYKKDKKPEKQSEKQPPSPCYRCGGQHWIRDCTHKQVICNYCKKTGHLEKCCRSKKNESKPQNQKVKSVIIGAASINSSNRIYKKVHINNKQLKMQLDTGADVTLLSVQDWKKIGSPILHTATIRVKSANHQPIKVLGSFKCQFTLNGQPHSGTAHVAETGTLLGTDWISKDEHLWKALNDSKQVNSASSDVGSACDYLDNSREKLKVALNSEFPNVFKEGLGKCTKSEAKLELKPDTKPIFRKARPVPYAALTSVSDEIDRLVSQGVLSPIDHSNWAAPIVIVRKKNGSMRLCADFSTGLNDALQQHQHPLPTANDVFTTLNGGKYFTQIDLAEAYLQVEMETESRQLLCINTHKGLYVFNRLPFGVKAAPGIFQQIIDSMISGIEGTASYLDDIIVCGSTEEEHNRRLNQVIRRINDYGFRMRLEKCTFLKPQIKFLGFIIDDQGRRPDPDKVRAIQNMPIPQNVSQVRSFLGLIQFYGTFVKKLFRYRTPLDELTKKDVEFKWTTKCQEAFEQIKKILQSDLLLTHFDPNLPIIVAADASQFGIGGVISHRFPDGSEKAIYHISKSLTKPQTNYSQIEKEAFGLITAVTKFHRFIHGRKFVLKTDHKPLLSIFGDKKGVPIYSANRLQRWATILLNYDFQIEYVNTNHFGQADALSRLIADQTENKEKEDQVIAQVENDVTANFTENCEQLPVTAQMIRGHSKKDSTLAEAIQSIQTGTWRKNIEKGTQLWSLFNRREQLSIVQECLLMGERIVIPMSLRNRVLKMLHRAHPGIVRMKKLARSFVYWPSIDSEIEKMVKSCDSCAQAAKDPVKNVLKSWPVSTAPWERVQADFAGPIKGIYYFLIIDSYSKWPEIIATKSITATATIKICRKIFGQFGNPETLVTDNGSQFTSAQFTKFCTEAGIKHIRSPPYHPQSNGQAERFVDSLKRALSKLQGEENDNEISVQTFLQSYRSTPCSASPNQATPAENFLGRKIRTTLDLLLPPKQESVIRNDQMEEQFDKQHGARPRNFQVNEEVYVKSYSNLSATTWIPGIIQRRIGYTIYKIKVDNGIFIRHSNQLRHRETPVQYDPLLELIDIEPNDTSSRDSASDDPPILPNPPVAPIIIVPPPPMPTLRRSTRQAKPPAIFVMNPKKKSYR